MDRPEPDVNCEGLKSQKTYFISSYAQDVKLMICSNCSYPIPIGEKICPKCGTPSSLLTAKKLPTGDSPDSCQICGNPLQGKQICDMCGSPAIPTTTEDDAIKCPICNTTLSDNFNCPKCGTIFGREEAEEKLQFQCPKCNKIIAVDDEVCSSCGTRIWMDEEVESKRLEELNCPFCGETVGEKDEKCEQCGFLLWVESDDDRLERAKKAIEEAKSLIKYDLEETGAAPKKAITYLEAATKTLEKGDADLAWRHALVALDVAQVDTRQKAILAEAEKRAKERMRSAESYGGDIKKCAELLNLSHQAKTKGDRKTAIRFALKCKILAENIENSLKRAPIGA